MARQIPRIDLPYVLWVEGYADRIVQAARQHDHNLPVSLFDKGALLSANLKFSWLGDRASGEGSASHEVGRVATEALGMALLCRRLSFLLETYEMAYMLGPEGVDRNTFYWEGGRCHAKDDFIRRIFQPQDEFDFEQEADAYGFEVIFVGIGSPLQFKLKIYRKAKAATMAAMIAVSPVAPTSPTLATVPAIAATTSQIPNIIAAAGAAASLTGVMVTIIHREHETLSKEVSEDIEEIQYEVRHGQGNALQRALADIGYYEGRIDGIIGPRTLSAARQFMTHRGLPTATMLTDPDFLRPLIRMAMEARKGEI